MPLITATKRSAEGERMEDSQPKQGESTGKRQRTFKEDHTLDSDEEDAEQSTTVRKQDVMEDDDIEGQEDGDMQVREGVRITPFNIQEELEEGHFDKDGNYHLNKEKIINDAWLENLDGYTDDDYEKLMKKKAEKDAAESAAAPPVPTDIELYALLTELLKPGETVTRALKRLGAEIKAVQKLRKGQKAKATEQVKEVDPAKEKFDKLAGAADLLLQKGNLEIYDETYEKAKYRLAKDAEKMASFKVDDELDMFGEVFDSGKSTGETSGRAPLATAESDDEHSEPQIAWEYKWTNTDAADIHGPYSTEQMNEWVQQDFFKDGVFVRKAGVIDAPFYSSKRVDFELYM